MKFLKKIIFLSLAFIFVLNNTNADLSISPLKFEINIENSNSKTKIIKIKNESEKPITLYISKEDFTAGDDLGNPKFIKPEDQEHPELSLTNWIELEEKNITLDSYETKEVKFKVNVPKNGEPGGHYGAIFFSPGLGKGGQISLVQRLGVLVLINVAGEVKIGGELKNFEIGQGIEEKITTKESFYNLPITFETSFLNTGNIHIKPKGKIELIGEDGEVFEKIGKEIIESTNGAYIGERVVNYIPVNDISGNILPNSKRKFLSTWKGFGYTILNEDGSKEVKFKNLSEYFEDKSAENQAYLKFYEEIYTKTVSKQITAKLTLYFDSKNLERKNFEDKKNFFITYDEKYIGMNYYILIGTIIFILIIITSIFYVLPKYIKKRDAKIKEELMKQMRK